MSVNHRYTAARRVTLVGAFSNAILGILKIFTGFWLHSQALIADGIHSLSDLLTDAMVLLASRLGSLDPDSTHPYGHQRIETAGTLFLALLLVLVGVAIAWDSLRDVMQSPHQAPELSALWVAMLSIIVNELLFQYTRRAGQRIRSALLIANAWHHRSDALSSLVVVLGLIGSMLGYMWFDALSALIVGLLIVKMGLHYGWDSVKELVDTAVSPALCQEITAYICGLDGVVKLHQLRTRQMGTDVFVDVHVMVDPWISVSEGHYIAQHVHQSLIDRFENIKDVTVHIDPEDDESFSPAMYLPSRTTLEKEHFKRLYDRIPKIRHIVLHYLEGRLILDIIVPDNQDKPECDFLNHYLAEHPDIHHIRVFYFQ